LLTYSLKDITSGTATAIDSSVFTVSSTTLTISTSNYLKIKTYILQLTATLTGYTVTNSITFNVNVYDSCDNVVITKNTLTT
jgi:hypothetical protein